MYLRRLRLHGVKNLHREIPGTGEPLPEASRKRLLLQGGNGSGKTTILECVRLLWEFFGEWIDHGNRRVEPLRRGLTSGAEQAVRGAELAAMELGDFPVADQQMWIGVGQANAWDALKREHPGAGFAGLVRYSNAPLESRIELPDRDWKSFRQRSMVGSEPQVNVVHFSSDNRIVSAPGELGPRLIDTTALNWSAAYAPDVDVDSLLLTLEALRPKDYEETVRLVNLALNQRNRRVAGFGEDGRLVIEGRTDFGTTYRHPPERLSAGEQQILLMATYAGGFLRPGGILLADDPDIHMQWTLGKLLLSILDMIVRNRGGQFIVASHSERAENRFALEDEKINLRPWKRRQG